MLTKYRRGIILVGLGLAMVAAGCKKKVKITPPPPAPTVTQPVEAPTAKAAVLEFSVEPTTIERGQSALLRWSVSNANNISLDNGIGVVPANGTRKVIPSETTTYTLRASGPGGEAMATTTVTVTAPAPPPPPANATPTGTMEQRLQTEVGDAYFDYDKGDIRDDARAVLAKDADALKSIFAAFPSATVVVEGHCDDRGSAEYNLGLADRRATAAKDFLAQLGVPADKLKTVSYGKERPQCTEASEDCYQKNRRAHFAPAQ